MKKSIVLSAAAGLALLFLSSAGASDADVKALRDNETQWNKDFASKDVNKLVAHYSTDAVLMSPGAPASAGQPAIRKTLQDMISDPALSLKFQASKVEVSKSGDMAYTQGSYTLTMTDPATKKPVHDHGSYVTTYRKMADGSWKAVADIASSESVPGSPQK